MRNPKIGLMSVSCPIHMESSNDIGEAKIDGTRIELLKKQLIDKLRFEVVNTALIIDSSEKTFNILKFFNNEEGDCILIFITTFVWANQYLQALRLYNFFPIALIPESRPQGLPTIGLTVMQGTLEQIGLNHTIFYGDILSEEFLLSIRCFVLASKVRAICKKHVLGFYF